MSARTFLALLLVASLWTVMAVGGGGAAFGSHDAAVGQRGSADASRAAPGEATVSRLSARQRRIRRYCRKAKRRMRLGRETRRQARKRKRLCRHKRRHPAETPAPRAPSLAPPVKPGTTAPRPVPLARYVSVQAREYYFTLSRPLVGTGEITIELRNNGEDPHNLVVSPEGTHDSLLSFADHDPGDVSATNATLPAGRYYLWCSLEGHEAAGMHATLRVE